jgi:DNA polymerase I-like protein with 3'-5' exonuclease and polymerase domains
MIKPDTKAAYQLFHAGTLVLARMEQNGIKIDVEYLDKAERETNARIGKLKKELTNHTDVVKPWRRRFGTKTNFESPVQLVDVFFGDLGFKYKKKWGRTKTGRYRSDKDVLAKIDHPYLRMVEELRKLEKVKGTYLTGLRRELVYGLVHPFFNLAGGTGKDTEKGGARSYRSSSQAFNFQNLPVRDPKQGEVVRRAIIPRKGRVLVERDFKGIEVVMSCCYHKDPVMIKYVTDPKSDMHRDVAKQLFFLFDKQVAETKKTLRHIAKNQFVFPQFYGSVWYQCAPAIWEALDDEHVVLDGRPVKQWLKKKGITELGECAADAEPAEGTFAYHVKAIEGDFWGRRFKVYAQWKEDFYQEYRKLGWFGYLTGFKAEGMYRRNQVNNYPIQGSAFHCLLWTAIETQKAIDKYKMKTLLIGQIHDSLLSDTPEKEIDQYLEITDDIVGRRLPKHWPWINVPMVIETEVARDNWYLKKSWAKNEKGLWQLEQN